MVSPMWERPDMVGRVNVSCGEDYNQGDGKMYRKRGLARDAAKTITRHAHGAVLELHREGVPKTNADWHYDLRRGRLCIYGGLLRFIDTCIADGKPHLARAVVAWLGWYVEDQINPTNTAELDAVA